MKIISKQILNKISQAPSHNQRINLIESEFTGTRKRKGSARICVPINDKWVLKVARNEKGIYQNQFEANCYETVTNYEKRYLAKVKNYSKDGTWLIQQRVKPLSYNKGVKLKNQLLKNNTFQKMISNLNLLPEDIDQIGIVKKQYKVYDYGLSVNLFFRLY